MSQTPSSGSSDKQWNLGKSRPSSPRTPLPPPVEKPPEKPAPAAAETVLDAILADEDNRVPLGRPMPESKGIRGALNHPLVMSGTGLLLVAAIMYLILGGSLAWMFGGRSARTGSVPTAEDRAAALVAGIGARQSEVEGRGRLLVAGGQILEASGRFLSTPQGVQPGAEVNHEYIPEHLTRLQMPPPNSPQFVEFRLQWDEQAMASVEMGQHVIRTARENSVGGDAVRGLATRLRAEGLALLDDTLEGAARSGIPGIEGARARLVAGTNLMSREETETLVTILMTDPLGQQIAAARPQSDAPPPRFEEEPPQP